jgi:hypothetical protein
MISANIPTPWSSMSSRHRVHLVGELLALNTKRHLSSSDDSMSDALSNVTASSCAISGELPASKNCLGGVAHVDARRQRPLDPGGSVRQPR